MKNPLLAIAANTIRDTVRQYIFYIVICGGLLLILMSFLFTLFAFGEEMRMIRDMGISTITVCCLCLVSLSATFSVSREMEDGIILTLLSKPVSRKYFLFGKFLGALGIAIISFLCMGIVLVVSLSVKNAVIYNLNILNSFKDIGFVTTILLFLSFLQVAIMTSVAIAGSIYLPMVSNLCCCMFVFILGNVSGFFMRISSSNAAEFPWWMPVFYMIFPNLELFNFLCARNDIAVISFLHILSATLYALFYIACVLLLVGEVFEKKEC